MLNVFPPILEPPTSVFSACVFFSLTPSVGKRLQEALLVINEKSCLCQRHILLSSLYQSSCLSNKRPALVRMCSQDPFMNLNNPLGDV